LADEAEVFGREPKMLKRVPWQEVCKFLAGAFFMNSAMLFYLCLYRVSVPVFSTGFTQTPEISCLRGISHFGFFLVFFYLGYLRSWKSRLNK
jgi:hypothetical protein